jgi:hypothetical protein
MKETKLSEEQLEVISNNNGLFRYLSGLSEGKKATPRSNLYNLPGKTTVLQPDEILAQWKQQLESLNSMDSFCKEVFQFDSHQLEKWGPQGVVAPIDDLLEDIVYPTFSRSEVPEAFNTKEWNYAKRLVIRKLHNAGCRGLAPVPYSRVVDDMRARDTLESNSGWPLFTRRNKPEVIQQSIEEAENGLWKTYPAIALFRNYNRKTRLVWMFPMSANLVEGSFFQPLQHILNGTDYTQVARFLSPWRGFEEVRDIITDVYGGSDFIAASDFSSTDAHFQLATSVEVYDVLAECFQPRFRGALRESIFYMHAIPLVIGVDRLLEGEHGVSSGSNWTNFIETIFDMILAEYVSLKGSYSGLYAIGDDMSWYSSEYDEGFADFLAEIGKSVGQEIKAEKTTNDRDKVVSLQRLFQRGFVRPDGKIRAVYPTIRALKSLVYPERFHKPELWSKDMEVIRAFMILENCVDHPLFESFCKFVAAGDPYMKVFAMKSTQEQRKLFRQSKLVPGLNSTYNQEKRDQALENFASVRLIAKL